MNRFSNFGWSVWDLGLNRLWEVSKPTEIPRKHRSLSALQILTDEQDLNFFYLNGFIVFPRLENPLKAVYNPAQKAMTEHNNEFCEWTCLYAPLPRGWNMISREWKPFENFIFKRNMGAQRAAAWRYEAVSVPDDGTTCVSTLSVAVFISGFLNVSLSVFSYSLSVSSLRSFSQRLSAGKHMNTCSHSGI